MERTQFAASDFDRPDGQLRIYIILNDEKINLPPKAEQIVSVWGSKMLYSSVSLTLAATSCHYRWVFFLQLSLSPLVFQRNSRYGCQYLQSNPYPIGRGIPLPSVALSHSPQFSVTVILFTVSCKCSGCKWLYRINKISRLKTIEIYLVTKSTGIIQGMQRVWQATALKNRYILCKNIVKRLIIPLVNIT